MSKIAQLSHGTIGRTRVVGRTRLGLPREETIPAVRGVMMYDRGGNLVHVSIHSHREFVPHLDDQVRPRVLRDLLEEGFLEIGFCPHMPRESLKGKPSVEPPEGFNERCDGGGKEGCSHLHAIVAERKTLTREKTKVRKPPSSRQQDIKEVVAAVIAAMKEGGSVGESPSDIAKIVEAVLEKRAPAGAPGA
ncbi:MAG: hypothetical protein F9K40_03080, partial [Kofleriaceae bacterium]